MWTISLPLHVPISKKKQFSLNLNQYRNAHFHTLDKAKKNFDEIAKELIRGIPRLERCTLEYILYPGTAQLCDVGNVCSVVDKFFSDSLVTHGVIDDDNYKIVVDVDSKFGCIDRDNPRVDVIIRSLDSVLMVPSEPLKEEGEAKMKITTTVTLTQADMASAIREYLIKHGLTAVPDAGSIAFTTNEDGYTIRLEQSQVAELPFTPDEPKQQHRTRAPKAEPKAAMAALRDLQEAKAAEAKPAPVAAPAPTETVPCQACGEQLNGENSSLSAKDGRVIHIGCKAGEKAPEAEAKPVEEQQEEEEKAPETAPVPPPAKGPSLFANFKRPSNG